jgi:hypothetical protein
MLHSKENNVWTADDSKLIGEAMERALKEKIK